MQVDVYITTDTSYAFEINRTNVREGGEETQLDKPRDAQYYSHIIAGKGRIN